MRKIGIIFLFALVFLPQLASAINREGAYLIEPSVGYIQYSNKRHINDQTMPGISMGYGVTQAISTEFYFGRILTDQSRGSQRDIRGALYTIDGFYHFMSEASFQPYLLAGVGAIHLKPSNKDDADTQASINVGAGVVYFFSNKIALRADVRDIYTMVGGKHDLMGNAAVVIMLGGQQSAQPAETNESNGEVDRVD